MRVFAVNNGEPIPLFRALEQFGALLKSHPISWSCSCQRGGKDPFLASHEPGTVQELFDKQLSMLIGSRLLQC